MSDIPKITILEDHGSDKPDSQFESILTIRKSGIVRYFIDGKESELVDGKIEIIKKSDFAKYEGTITEPTHPFPEGNKGE